MMGETDIDLLVDRNQSTTCEAILAGLGLKRCISQPWVRYPGIEDWIGMDEETKKLIHVHLHYRLLTGEQFVKEQNLPWETLLLETAVRDPEFLVLTADPSLEILLLIIRIALKTDQLDLLKAVWGGNPVPDNMLAEFDYLYERMDREKVTQYAEELVGASHGQDITRVVKNKSIVHPSDILLVKRVIREVLGHHRRFNSIQKTYIYLSRLFQFYFASAQRRLGSHTRTRKRLHNGGVIIAIVGADGAGKSTVSEELHQWLSWKMDSNRVYLGSGSGATGIGVKFLQFLASLVPSRETTIQTGTEGKTAETPRNSLPREIGSCLLGLSIARQRHRKVLQMNRVRLSGGIVITDRYPQDQFKGIYDGPSIYRGENDSNIRRFFAAREAKKYRQITDIYPDIVIKLHIPVEAAHSRKPDHDLENIRKKIAITRALTFPESKTIDLDASARLEQVLSIAKKAVWDYL
jgi:thymidylate kinase